MQFEITSSADLATVSVEGTLNALDLLFMLQSKSYKKVISEYNKVLVDYTEISGSTLTMDDAVGIALLGKLELDKRENIHIVIAIDDNEGSVMEKVTNDIFANSKATVSIVNSRKKAKQMLTIS